MAVIVLSARLVTCSREGFGVFCWYSDNLAIFFSCWRKVGDGVTPLGGGMFLSVTDVVGHSVRLEYGDGFWTFLVGIYRGLGNFKFWWVKISIFDVKTLKDSHCFVFHW